ncbi:hypothetical protein BMS3Abin03_02551 [bacterium BMS3Abin03]|nr:hypothetical protein BMS3Abin03_02551 [bacterium BMS3Abin03]
MEFFVQFLVSDLSLMEKISIFSILFPFTISLVSERMPYIILFSMGSFLEIISVAIYLGYIKVHILLLYHFYTSIELGLLAYILLDLIYYKYKVRVAVLLVVSAVIIDYLIGNYNNLDLELTQYQSYILLIIGVYVGLKTSQLRYGVSYLLRNYKGWILLAVGFYCLNNLVFYSDHFTFLSINIIYNILMAVGIWRVYQFFLPLQSS